MKRAALRNGAPSEKESPLVSPMSGGTEKIHPPNVALFKRLHAQCPGLDSDLGVPEAVLLLDSFGMVESGIPGGIVERRFRFFYFQIDPLVVWRDFEFVVMRHSFGF